MLIARAIVVAISISGVMTTTAYAGELPATGCEPSWARACVPATSGMAPLEGAVGASRNFAYSSIALMYRTTEGSLGPHAGTAEYGAWHTTDVGSTGAFSLLLPACGAQARFTGCIGGAYEIYATYRGQPCTEMWYASLFVGEPDRLPGDALTCTHTSSSVAALTGGEGFQPGCEPYLVRNCMPGTTGTTSILGAISGPEKDNQPFSLTHVTMAYRTVEVAMSRLTMSGESLYGTTHYLKVGSDGAFSSTLRGCSPSAQVFGCDGGDIEAWPLYDKVACGEISARILVTGKPQTWSTTICDNRGLLEGSLHAAKSTSWKLVAHGDGVTKTHVKEDGKFSLLLAAGSYRVIAQNGRKRCVAPVPVKIRIAKITHLTMHC
jgi:hypothetical protein